jgi:hypothetical protein
MNNLYTPPGCTNLASSTHKQQIRLGIQGFPGTGKTWSALTFNNPIVINLDRGLGAHQGRADVIEVPFYDRKFCTDKCGVKDHIIEWLDSEGMKLTPDQTLVIDGLSELEICYHLWFAANQMSFLTPSGKVDSLKEWSVKKAYFGELGDLVKRLHCDVIMISHEAEKADKSTTIGQPGQYTGKIRPLLSGASGDIIVGNYTDWFRQHSASKPTDFSTITPDSLHKWGMKSTKEFKDMCDTYPRDTIYFWQTVGDDKFDGKCSSLVEFPQLIPANFANFQKYMRKLPTIS